MNHPVNFIVLQISLTNVCYLKLILLTMGNIPRIYLVQSHFNDRWSQFIWLFNNSSLMRLQCFKSVWTHLFHIIGGHYPWRKSLNPMQGVKGMRNQCPPATHCCGLLVSVPLKGDLHWFMIMIAALSFFPVFPFDSERSANLAASPDSVIQSWY